MVKKKNKTPMMEIRNRELYSAHPFDAIMREMIKAAHKKRRGPYKRRKNEN